MGAPCCLPGAAPPKAGWAQAHAALREVPCLLCSQTQAPLASCSHRAPQRECCGETPHPASQCHHLCVRRWRLQGHPAAILHPPVPSGSPPREPCSCPSSSRCAHCSGIEGSCPRLLSCPALQLTASWALTQRPGLAAVPLRLPLLPPLLAQRWQTPCPWPLTLARSLLPSQPGHLMVSPLSRPCMMRTVKWAPLPLAMLAL